MKTSRGTNLAIRTYSERPGRDPLAMKPRSRDPGPSSWAVIFDCETTTDAKQTLRFGFYQVRDGGGLKNEGIFVEREALTPEELAQVTEYASAQGLEMISVEAFRRAVFLRYGYRQNATIVGFNLPFDLSRIAIAHAPARHHMRGGFSFKLTPNKDDPAVRIKHLSPKAALIDFAKPGKQATPGGMRRRKIKVDFHRGHFVDVKTFAAAILSQRHTLKSLAAALGTATQKHGAEEHGRMSAQYLDYARTDVQVTWECYRALIGEYAEHALSRPADRLLSEASVGKGYLQEMRIRPLLECDPTFSRQRLGEILCAYYGGRAEVRLRRIVCEVLYCDFKSMYPTVNSLMGLWKFVIARGVMVEDTTVETQSLLERITLEDLQRPATWERLCTFVRLQPQEDILPARVKYDGETYTIGLNHLSAAEPLWYTLADCIVSKPLTGRCPRIEKALTYRPGPSQEGLVPTKILGRTDFKIDPTTDDFFTRLVDMRDQAKAAESSIEKALKIIANSTSYGIFIEVNRDDAPKAEPLDVFGPHGKKLRIATAAIEEPGRYFHPLLGVLITGAARLMLGIAEKKTLDVGLDWAFCDTDSLAMVRPEGMTRQEFHKRAREVIDWFTPLNPYTKPGSILREEDLNRGIGSDEMEPLYCYAISAKRYALFNVSHDGLPILRKASAHGLGHLVDPYPESEATTGIPPPQVPLTDMGIRRWQYDLWYKIITAALRGDPDRVLLDWHPALQKPAAIRYTASSPQLLKWLDHWNQSRPEKEQIRPFTFLLYFMARTGVFATFTTEPLAEMRRGRPRKNGDLAPIAPYDSDPTRALTKVFDRVTGKPIDPKQLKTYAEVLAQYHLSCEDKFENGEFLDRGRTERRHVVATGFVWIGKEANQVGESGEEDPIWSAVEEFAAKGSPV
jgi:hypothetical protein